MNEEEGDLVPQTPPTSPTPVDGFTGLSGWSRQLVSAGVVGFICIVAMRLINDQSSTHDRTVEVVIGASDKTLDVMEKRWRQEREDRREERAADRESLRRTWDSLREIRTAVDRNTTALNELSQAVRMVGQ